MAMSLQPDADRELIARLRRGDEAAFELIFREHCERLCGVAARLLGSRAVAEELVQDVFCQLWERRSGWSMSDSISGYLYMAVRNRALNQIRRDRQHQRWSTGVQAAVDAGAMPGMAEAADAEASAADLQEAIDQALAELPPRCRQAFVLRRQQHLSYAEIARIMEVSPKTVEVQIGAALRALRRRLAEWL